MVLGLNRLHLLLATLVSLPAFCAGHLLQKGSPERALVVALLSIGVVVVAAALAHRAPGRRATRGPQGT